MNPIDFGHEARRLRVGTLVRLRWIAAAGQIAAIAFTRYVLHIGFPMAAAALCVAMLLAFNLILRLKFSPATRLEEKATTLILAVDIGQLGVMLFLTGGLANPFAVLLIAPTMISAVSQSWLETGKLLAFAIFSACVLAIWRVPLALPNGTLVTPPLIETVGLAARHCRQRGFRRVLRRPGRQGGAPARRSARRHRPDPRPGATPFAARRPRRGGRPRTRHAAGDAHRRRARTRQQPDVAALCGEDLALAEQELARCRAILGQLSQANRVGGRAVRSGRDRRAARRGCGAASSAGHRHRGVGARSRAAAGLRAQPGAPLWPAQSRGERRRLRLRADVRIEATWTRDKVEIAIDDDGPGFPPAVLAAARRALYLRPQRRPPRRRRGRARARPVHLQGAAGAYRRRADDRQSARAAARGAVVAWPRELFGNQEPLVLAGAGAYAKST